MNSFLTMTTKLKSMSSHPLFGVYLAFTIILHGTLSSAQTDCMYDGDCNYSGICFDGRCSCNVGYSGIHCEYYQSSSTCTIFSSDCNHGYCSGGYCSCDIGWSGTFCDVRDECTYNYDCGNNAQCLKGLCSCKDGYSGDDCEVFECTAFNSCGSYGYCSAGICECIMGYSGTFCDVKDDCMFNSDCTNGYCSSGKCICYYGFSGSKCDVETHTDCSTDSDCNNNGYCSIGLCYCDPGYSGSTCLEYSDLTDDESRSQTTYIHYIIGFVVLTVIAIAICIIRMSLRTQGRNVANTTRFTTVTTNERHPVTATVPPQPPSSQQPYQHYPSWYEPFQSSQQNRRADTTVPIVITPPQPSAPAIEQPPAYNSVTNDPGEENLPPPPSYDAAMEMREGDVTGNIPNLYSAPQPALAREDRVV
ncbi:uncharacterized protein LOC102806450 [Saccoglossus kowalevskii]